MEVGEGTGHRLHIGEAGVRKVNDRCGLQRASVSVPSLS
jgi:hypothetical protein